MFWAAACGLSFALMEYPPLSDRALSEVTPWSMSQQFGLRLVAQICFNKLWSRIHSAPFPSLKDKYTVLAQCLDKR